MVIEVGDSNLICLSSTLLAPIGVKVIFGFFDVFLVAMCSPARDQKYSLVLNYLLKHANAKIDLQYDAGAGAGRIPVLRWRHGAAMLRG